MKLKPEQLDTTLIKQLSALYCVFGAELLLVEQSLTKIRAAAKTQGFDDKVSFEVDGGFDWDKIIAEISAGSLFSPKRIIECRFTTGKIGVKGAKALTQIASSLPGGVILIIIAGKLDISQQKSKWFKTLEQHGQVIQHWEVQNEHLLGWISNHMAALKLAPNPEVAQSIAFCTQGNLLASMQEIQKLKMAYPDGKIDTQAYLQQANQQSKYTIYGLIDAALLGDSNQLLKIYEVLTTPSFDTTMQIQLSNSLYREISSIIDMSIELQKIKPIDAVLQNHRVWQKRKIIITNVLKRHSYQHLQKILLSLGRIERSIKGMDILNVTDELRILLLNLAGKNQWLR